MSFYSIRFEYVLENIVRKYVDSRKAMSGRVNEDTVLLLICHREDSDGGGKKSRHHLPLRESLSIARLSHSCVE